MSSFPMTGGAPEAPPRAPSPRVRHQAREAAALMVFSALTSVGVAMALMLIASLGHRA